MKTSFKILSLVVCTLLLFVSCHSGEETEIYERPLFYHSFTDYVGSPTNSYVQVGDSTYYFHFVESDYSSYRGRTNENIFYLWLFSPNLHQDTGSFNIHIGIHTDMIKPENFFQKGVRKINSIDIRKRYEKDYVVSEGFKSIEYTYTKSLFTCLFTWDTIVYENRIFKGKGSLEILDTLYFGEQDVYYPPQKIEFEFK